MIRRSGDIIGPYLVEGRGHLSTQITSNIQYGIPALLDQGMAAWLAVQESGVIQVGAAGRTLSQHISVLGPPGRIALQLEPFNQALHKLRLTGQLFTGRRALLGGGRVCLYNA